jgi:FkbM family methyltransferase
MKIPHRAKWYYRTAGVFGVLTVVAHRLLGRPTEIGLRPPGIPGSVHIRIRTTDEGAYEQIFEDQQYAIDLPFSPRVIVDAGANIGTASIYFAHRYPEARIIAIEAEASNFALLSKNAQPYPKITPIHAALWSHDGEMSLTLPEAAKGPHEKWAFYVHDGPGTPVRTISMRSLMNEMKIASIDVLKVDIEGAEKEVFESCDWIDAVRCVMIELHDRFKPGCSAAVSSVMQGFSVSQQGETTYYCRQA